MNQNVTATAAMDGNTMVRKNTTKIFFKCLTIFQIFGPFFKILTIFQIFNHFSNFGPFFKFWTIFSNF